MISAPSPANPRGFRPLVGWRRVVPTLCISVLFGALNDIQSVTPAYIMIGRAVMVGLLAMLAFGFSERWPPRLPGWLARWVFQLLAIAFTVPVAAWLAYLWTTGGHPDFANEPLRIVGFAMLCVEGVLVGPWIALGAMVRQREAFVHHQALAFDLERSELERKALDARMRLLQAQVEPHFLFNTLANVQELVDARSPQASTVLKSLVAYLRAAVPRLHETSTSLGQELQLVRAYLDVMHMRMPDRLQFVLQVDKGATEVACPPMTLLTLVENAVRHGIDPSEVGGRIDIEVSLAESRCRVRVTDTGVGLQPSTRGAGTGLASLRERLQLTFGADAQLRLSEIEPHGVCAELDFPARKIDA